jgi:hypothetical protein
MPYILVEEPKSIREVYIRVAVIDIDISAGVTNIYIRGRHYKLVLSASRSRKTHTM